MENIFFYIGAIVLAADFFYKIFLEPPIRFPEIRINRRRYRDIIIAPQTCVSLIELAWLIAGCFTSAWYAYVAIMVINIIISYHRKDPEKHITAVTLGGATNIIIALILVIYQTIKNFI